MTDMNRTFVVSAFLTILCVCGCTNSSQKGPAQSTQFDPGFRLNPSEKFYFNSFVDCNMAEVWVGDTFRIFPGKYGEDPLWGNARDLKFADGKMLRGFQQQGEAFYQSACRRMLLLEQPDYGAVFETAYQIPGYNRQNTATRFTAKKITRQHFMGRGSGMGYKDEKWPQV
jgi:hypothetical protein